MHNFQCEYLLLHLQSLNKKNLNFPAKLKVPILQIRFGKKGDKVSYGRTETLVRDSTLATIGIGYADGILRILKKMFWNSI